MFALLSAAVRLHILWLLAGGERDVSSLAEATGQTVATVSHHLGKLKLGWSGASRDRAGAMVLRQEPAADRIAVGAAALAASVVAGLLIKTIVELLNRRPYEGGALVCQRGRSRSWTRRPSSTVDSSTVRRSGAKRTDAQERTLWAGQALATM
jgi:DNA-binding transcriptional ArsR family regulator